MLVKTFDSLKNIRNLSELRLPVLFFGIAVWIVMPIIGIIPILLAIQLDLLAPRRTKPNFFCLNNWLLLAVVLTITIYISSFDVFADTQIYLNIYKSLDTNGIFDNRIVKERNEFVLFLLLYPVNILTNGSEYWCLFLFSLLINTSVFFYVARGFSPQYYPTILILLCSNPFYYSQIFYLRQFLSIVFVLMAMLCLDSGWFWFILWSFMAVFSHTTSGIYIGILLVVKLMYILGSKIKFKLQKKDKALLYLILGILLILLLYFGLEVYNNPQQIYAYLDRLLGFLPQKEVSTSLQSNLKGYDGRDTDTFTLTVYRVISFASIGVFVLIRGFKKLSPKLLSLDLFYVISLYQIAFILVTGFNQRIAFVILAFYGIFFDIGLNDQSKAKRLGTVSLLTMFIVAANTFNFFRIQDGMIDVKGWSFFEGQPLAMSLYDYIVYFFQSI
jgi:hypothetical protein